MIGYPRCYTVVVDLTSSPDLTSVYRISPKGWIRYNFPILWYLLLLSREIDTRRGEGDQESADSNGHRNVITRDVIEDIPVLPTVSQESLNG